VGGTDWFDVHELGDHTYVISEPMHVNSYLLVGRDRALLFDTGMGVADMRGAARRLTGLPILAVNSHHHFDHVAGNAQFDDVAIHESGAQLLEEGPPADWLTSYWRAYAEFMSDFGAESAAAAAAAAAVVEWGGAPPRPLPDSFDVDDPPFVRTVASRLLRDGDVLDLGDRAVTVLHTPGHSVDSICLLDSERRLLLSGDTVDSTAIYLHLPSSSVDDLARSAARLEAEAVPEIDAVVGGHSATFRSDPDIVSSLRDAVGRVLARDVELRPSVDCFGADVKEAVFDRLSLTLPPDY
jgi:glyoxylase-like metal-dependent hydrolase (beta-lactamase superfamily II)